MSFKPKRSQEFYMLNSRGNVQHTFNNGSEKTKARIAFGNAFRTQAEAEKFRDRVSDLANHGYYLNAPKPGMVATILTYLVYLLLILLVLAACCLVVDFVCWIYDIKLTMPRLLR